ncbi:uncharacterized protein LOC113359721 [Papaver somniferum]|uniref:uncharacterized protein LOC113359721 n=1 Tax=Papaver somniferum TaxID=3469 RepID=UPI000E6FEC57|nr:uncharacterized protein LOC113359721 [Papaver somniferum]
MEYYQAYNGRENVYKTIYGDDVKSYSHLVWYIDAIRDTNPGSGIKVEFDHPQKQFQRIFIAFAACIKRYRFCRQMVYLDATSLTGRFRGCLMEATGINGGKGFFPLAVGLVDSETIINWKCFCYYHLTQNLPITGSDPRYSLVMDLFQEATYALSPENHVKAIQKIRDLNCDWVADYIETIPPEAYVNAYFKGCRYGRTSSTLAESLNSWVLIRRKIMCLMAEHREIGANMMTPLTHEYEEKLASLQDQGLSWEVFVASPTVLEVFSERMCIFQLH